MPARLVGVVDEIRPSCPESAMVVQCYMKVGSVNDIDFPCEDGIIS